MIAVDATLLVQLVAFLLLLVFMNVLLFKPLLRLLEARKGRVEGTLAAARQLEQETQRLVAEYEAKLQEAREQAASEREQLLQQAVSQTQVMLRDAAAEAEARLDEGRRAIARDVADAQVELRRQAEELAREIAQKLLGRRLG